MQARTWSVLVLLALPAFSGCAVFDRPDRWDLDLSLGLIVSPRAGAILDDVAQAVELAARQLDSSQEGILIRVVSDAATDSSAAAVDRLAGKKVAVIVAALAPDEARAAAQRAAAQKIPLLLVTPPDAPVTGVDTNYFLQVAPPIEAEPRALATLAADQNASTLLLFRPDDLFSVRAGDAFDAAYNGDLLDTIVFAPDSEGTIVNAARSACSQRASGAVLLAKPQEAGWIVRGLHEGGCGDTMTIVASSSARQPRMVEEAGRDQLDRPYARGVMGVEPAGARLGEFRTLIENEFNRDPTNHAAAAYDAVTYVALAAFASKSNLGARPVRDTIDAAELQPEILAAAEQPGIKQRDLHTAIEGAQSGDEIDWVGFAHDFDFDANNAPTANDYDTWFVTQTGGIDRAN